MSAELPQKEAKSPNIVGRFSSKIIQPRDILCGGPNQQLTGGGNVLHRIQKAERLNKTSLPKMMIPSGTAGSTRRRASGGSRKLQARVDVRGTNPLMVRVTTKVVINALSAAGSRIEPRTEPMLYFRAKYPST